MMYSELVAGTGCKQTEKNYEIFKELEIIYMNSNCTKEHIYEMGRKLVDNSKSEKEIEFEKRIMEKIKAHKETMERYKGYIETDKETLEYSKMVDNKELTNKKKSDIRYWQKQVKYHKAQIAALKWVLED